jgi:hypothetical protein
MSKKSNSRMAKSFDHKISSYGTNLSQDQRIDRFTCHFEGSIASTAGGNILTAIPMDPSGSGDWADFTSTYDEFHVVGVRLNLISVQTNATAVNNSLLAIAYDDDTGSAPASVTAVRQYATSSVHSTIIAHNQGKPLTLVWWRPTTGSLPLWIDVATPSGSLGSIQLAAGGLSASTTYLNYGVDYYIEFRGRR